MKYVISGKNMEVTDSLREAVESKLGKLEKYFAPEAKCMVKLTVEKGGRERAEVTIPVKKGILRSEQVSNDMYVSIDLVEEAIERQLKKYKKKLIDRRQTGADFQQAFVEKEYDVPEEEIVISRSKKFEIKPMYPEDACVQMELLGHSFFVFNNADTGATNVVYKRKNGAYGLIEPEA